MAFKNNSEYKRFQRLIDACVRHGAAYYDAQAALMDLCREKYGVEPGDVDADEIIDSFLGGCGCPVGMSAERFDEIMSQLTEDD